MSHVWQGADLHLAYRVGRFPFVRRRPALQGATFSIGAGERVAIVGPSGSGKSSLVHCALGLVPPDGGAVSLFGQETARWRPRDWRRARQHVQVLFQDPRAMLHPHVPIGAWLADSAAIHRPGESPWVAAERALGEVGLQGRFDALPEELSGGEQRRVGLARVLLASPRLLVADEPTSGLDAAVKATMLELMLDRVGPDCTVVLVSHDLSTVAQVCGRLLVVDGGEVVDSVPTSALRSSGWSPGHPCTAALLEAAGWTSRQTAEA